MTMAQGLTASQCVEAAIDERCARLEGILQLDVMSYVGPLLYGTDDVIRDVAETRRPRSQGLAVLLETTGGYIEPVRRIVSVLRTNYGHVEFVVPSHAMSAGTILVMSGDAIRMDYYSVLGPIDPQVERDGQPVPALGYLQQYKRLLAKANRGRASSAEMAILLKFDQAELYSYEQDRELSIALLKDWLARYKFKDWKTTATRCVPVSSRMRVNRAAEVAKALNDTDRWHTHGHGITMEVLQTDLKLRIDDFGSDPDLSAGVHSYHRLVVDYMRRTGRTYLVHRPGMFVF